MSIAFTFEVEAAVRRGDSARILHLLASLPSDSQPARLMRLGFEARGCRGSFIQLCAEYRDAKLLEHVVRQAPFGLTLDDFSNCYLNSAGTGPQVYTSLHALSVAKAFPEGLKLALELEPQNKVLTEMLPLGASQATLHFIALYNGVWKPDLAEHLRGLLQCARLLREHGASIAHAHQKRNAAADAWFSRPWAAAIRAELPALLREYVDAGIVDIQQPSRYWLNDRGFSYAGKNAPVPLEAVIEQGCITATTALIELGATLPPGRPDLHDLVRDQAHPEHIEAPLLAAVTKALMSRTISRAAAAAASATPPMNDTQNDTPAPTRRRMRSTL